MPYAIEKLKKFLQLEIDRNYDNRAIVGGLDKIIPMWEKDSQLEKISPDQIEKVKTELNNYQNLDLAHRCESIDRIMFLLTNYPNMEFQHSQQKTEKASDFIEAKNPKKQNTAPSANSQTVKHAIALDAPLTVITGIGLKKAEDLKPLGLCTLGDLFYYFPKRYIDYSSLKTINRISAGEELTIIGTIQSISSRKVRNGQLAITEIIVSDSTGFIRLNWFNQDWPTRYYHDGDQIVLSGKVEMYLGRLVINQPDIENLEKEHLHTNRIVPVYPLNAKISQKVLRRLMFETIKFWSPKVIDFLPASIKNNANLIDLSTALHQVHFPDSDESLIIARHRLAFDEIFLLQLGVLQQKKNWQSATAKKFVVNIDQWDSLLNSLPYELTQAQLKVVSELQSDLTSGYPMNRLLQGDVGSGKTIVAALTAAIVIAGGGQATFMAPTSILAEQHFHTLINIFRPDSNITDKNKHISIRLLIGDTPAQEKAEILEELLDGTINLVIGTHALIEEPVHFHNLQFVVIDEQHRFGVEQRALIRKKGKNPHLLVMTATPIPRSLALTIYGDLDLSIIDELPRGRIPIQTFIIGPRERERAYSLIKSQIEKGYQAFIVYPLVEAGEKEEVKAAVDEHSKLQEEIFPGLKIGLIHGRMKQEEKEKVMSTMRDHGYDILVSTSVVEVGVDIPNATVMLIEGANHFGLAQLHQFRGRVGRNKAESFCLLVPDTEDSLENHRLQAMVETNDGFVLAERDLNSRGPGDFLGTRQAGLAELKLASLTDIHLIEKARMYALEVFNSDSNLSDPNHIELQKKMDSFWQKTKSDIS